MLGFNNRKKKKQPLRTLPEEEKGQGGTTGEQFVEKGDGSYTRHLNQTSTQPAASRIDAICGTCNTGLGLNKRCHSFTFYRTVNS